MPNHSELFVFVTMVFAGIYSIRAPFLIDSISTILSNAVR